MSCRVDERVAVRNLERIGNELRAVIGLRESEIFAYKVSVRRNFSAVDFRVVGRNEQNWHDPQAALQCQRAGDFARDGGKGKRRKRALRGGTIGAHLLGARCYYSTSRVAVDFPGKTSSRHWPCSSTTTHGWEI
jgi:hypothetical protein